MGHPIVHATKQIIKQLNSNFDVNKDIKPNFCNTCQFGNCHMQHFSYTNTQPLESSHADIWG